MIYSAIARQKKTRSNPKRSETKRNKAKSMTEEMKQALREAPRTRYKIAAERRRICERALILQRSGLNQTVIAARLGVSRRYLATCLHEPEATMALDSAQTRQDRSPASGCALLSCEILGPS